MKGWYRQQRNLSERPWAKDASAVQLYIFLKEYAYVQDGSYNGIIIRRGSCPMTRSELMELTGMKYKKLDLTLNLLKSYGEIIVKGNSRFTVISVCDYDSYNQPESLFGTTEDITKEITEETTGETTEDITHISYKEGIKNKEEDNLRSLFNPSKNEREKDKGLIYEIKKLYNKKFEGVLPEWKRLSDKMAIKVAACITRYGRQSVDMVFDQVLHEKFSLGQNKTGFIADFDFIFRLNEYEKYLSRYELRKKKSGRETDGANNRALPDTSTTSPSPTEKRRTFLLGWITSETEKPTKRGQELLMACRDSGELEKLGLNWKPNYEEKKEITATEVHS